MSFCVNLMRLLHLSLLHINKLLRSKLACEFTVHEQSTAIRNVAADTEFVTTECWCDEHSGRSVFSGALFMSPYRKQAPLSDLQVVEVKSPVGDTLSPSLQGLTDTVILITCGMSIKCTKFKWCLPCQSDNFPLKTIRRFTQVFTLLHTLP